MNSVNVYSLESPSDAEIDEMAKLASDAFVDVVYIMMMTGGDERFKPDLFRLSVRTAILEGNVTVCQDRSTGQILSYALSFGPGKMFLASDVQRKDGIHDYIKELSDEGKKWWEQFLKDAENWPSQVLENWFTIVLATEPKQQRKGYGSLVMKETIKMAERDGTFVVLKAPEWNVPFYQRLGFEVQDTLVTESPYGTYTDHTMVWKPKAEGISEVKSA